MPAQPRIRLTAVLTHPIQYYGPWFRFIATDCREIELTVLYAIEPTPQQQGVGFGNSFSWDTPLTDGYHCRFVRGSRPEDSVSSDRFWGLNVPEIGAAIRETRPDVALIVGWHSITLLRALRACRSLRIPTLFRGDSNLTNRPVGWRGPVWELKTRLLLRAFSGYLSVGQRSREYLEHFGAGDAKIFDAPHCVDNASFAAASAPYQTDVERARARKSWGFEQHDFVVLFVGKLEPKKRPMDLLQAISRLGPGVKLLAVGAGPLESACRAEAERLGVDVVWSGFVNQSELGKAYASADCLALPSSEGETWGLVVNEAFATGLPCVVSDRVGCAPDMITPGETGEIFPMGDIGALVGALSRVRRLRASGYDYSAACRNRASDYSIERATEGLLAACRAVARGNEAEDPGSKPVRVIACCGGMVVAGGLERMTFEVLRVLRERGAAVHCIVNSWENHRITALAKEIDAAWSTGYYWYGFDRHTRNPIKLGQFAWDILRTSLGLLTDAWRFRPTHVLAPEFMAVLRNAPALGLLRLLGVRVILRLGNAPNPGNFYRRVWRWGVNPFVDRFVCNSRFIHQELLAHGIAPEKSSVIYNTVSRHEANRTNGSHRDARKVIYVGQVIPEKGIHVLLDAVGILVSRGYDPRLDVVGDIEGWVSPRYSGYREQLLKRANSPDLAGRVRFLGWREDVPELLRTASVHCCPSLPEQREGLANVNLEAKQAGTPSVVFPTGALPELIRSGEDGWVCSQTSSDALAEGIEYILADPMRGEAMGRAASESLNRFSRKQFSDAWRREFERRIHQ